MKVIKQILQKLGFGKKEIDFKNLDRKKVIQVQEAPPIEGFLPILEQARNKPDERTADIEMVENKEPELSSEYYSEILGEPPLLFRTNIGGMRHYYRHDEAGRPIFYKSVTTIQKGVKGVSKYILEWALEQVRKGHDYYSVLQWYADRGTLTHIVIGFMMKQGFINTNFIDTAKRIDEKSEFYVLVKTIVDQEEAKGELTGLIGDANKEFPRWYQWNMLEFCKKALLASAKWMLDYKVQIVAIEPKVYNDDGFYAGAIDLICVIEVKGEKIRALVDFKTSKQVNDDFAEQLHAYRLAWNKQHPEFMVDRIYNLLIGKDWRSLYPKTGAPYSFVDQSENTAINEWEHTLRIDLLRGRSLPKRTEIVGGLIDLSNITESLTGAVQVYDLEDAYSLEGVLHSEHARR